MLWTKPRLLPLSAVLLIACGSSVEGLKGDFNPVNPGDGGQVGGDSHDGPGAVSANDPSKGGSAGDGDDTPDPSDGGEHHSGDAGASDAGASDSDAGDTPVDCPQDTCCIDGNGVPPETINPDNGCQWCDPALSSNAFSAYEQGTCGTGCQCQAGSALEASCDDSADNDSDGKLDCADDDCAMQRCQASTTALIYPTKDLQVEDDGLIARDKRTDGSTTLTVSKGKVATQTARFEFDSIRGNDLLTIQAASLKFYVQNRVSVRGPGTKGASLGTTEAGSGLRAVDVTALVKRWVQDASVERSIILEPVGNDLATVFATEFKGTENDPRIEVTYEAVCDRGACPTP
jgi:hypothetical protein